MELIAVVTLTDGGVTDESTVTVNDVTVPLLQRAQVGGRLAPLRIIETLENLGYQVLEILPCGRRDAAVEVRVLDPADQCECNCSNPWCQV